MKSVINLKILINNTLIIKAAFGQLFYILIFAYKYLLCYTLNVFLFFTGDLFWQITII